MGKEGIGYICDIFKTAQHTGGAKWKQIYM